MLLIVIACIVAAALELSLWLPLPAKLRAYLAGFLLVGVGLSSVALLGFRPAIWSALIAFFSLYRMLNLLRLIKGRVQADYLYNAARRTSVWLLCLQLIIAALAGAANNYHPPALVGLYALAAVQISGALVIVTSTFRNIAASKPPHRREAYADSSLPSLTVALPARNETDDLQACLQSLVTSDYPKLEIVVLDDCSQNKRTPEIIRDFAHNGVTFIAGAVPPEHWLAKNYAYQQLADTANGELLLFCGVDTRFQVHSLRAMVETLLETKTTMLSFIPRNVVPKSTNWPSIFVQPARYAWELALPRTSKRPGVLSTCWLITAEALHAAGSFKAVSRGHSPESYFARFAGQEHGYRFLQADSQLGLDSLKSLAEQQATAIRTRYPQLHRRPEMVSLITLAQALFLTGPFILLVAGLMTRHWGVAALSAATCVLLTVSFARIVALAYRRFLIRGVWSLLPAVLYDIGLLHYSMWQYEFSEVIWKGRNICIPVMRAVPDWAQR